MMTLAESDITKQSGKCAQGDALALVMRRDDTATELEAQLLQCSRRETRKHTTCVHCCPSHLRCRTPRNQAYDERQCMESRVAHTALHVQTNL